MHVPGRAAHAICEGEELEMPAIDGNFELAASLRRHPFTMTNRRKPREPVYHDWPMDLTVDDAGLAALSQSAIEAMTELRNTCDGRVAS